MIADWGVVEWSSAAGLAAAAIGGIGWLSRLYLHSSYATRAELRGQNEQIGQLRARTEVVERRLESLATREDVYAIKLAIERADGDRRELSAKVDGIVGSIAGTNHQLGLIHQHLLAGERQ